MIEQQSIFLLGGQDLEMLEIRKILELTPEVLFFDELMYYGKGKEHLASYFESEINAGKMFHGGGADGFFGIARGAYAHGHILSLKDSIIQFMTKPIPCWEAVMIPDTVRRNGWFKESKGGDT